LRPRGGEFVGLEAIVSRGDGEARATWRPLWLVKVTVLPMVPAAAFEWSGPTILTMMFSG